MTQCQGFTGTIAAILEPVRQAVHKGDAEHDKHRTGDQTCPAILPTCHPACDHASIVGYT
jgi:hypothetical protein